MLAKVLGGVGRTLITAGTLILLFVAYQLWGTNLQQAKSQRTLSRQFEQTLATAPTTTASTTTTTTPGSPVSVVPVTTAPAIPLPKYGDAIAQLRIPKIGLRATVVEGVGLDQLKRGPGHYQETPLPGQKGNAAIAGHRTTYGAPFHNVDKLANGDQIIVKTLQGEFVYEVDSIKIVRPDEVDVLADKGDNRITLTACHPKYSARQRIIISGVLKGAPAPKIAGQDEPRDTPVTIPGDGPSKAAASIDGGLSGNPKSKTPAIVWGLVCAGIWLATWLASRLVHRNMGRRRKYRWIYTSSPYLVGVPVFLVALYVFFENFAVLLPANF
jgi:sortase A